MVSMETVLRRSTSARSTFTLYVALTLQNIRQSERISGCESYSNGEGDKEVRTRNAIQYYRHNNRVGITLKASN